MNTLRAGVYASLIVIMVFLTVFLWKIEPKAENALDSVQAMELNTTRTEAELAGLLNVTRQVAIQERQAQAAQLQQVAAIGASTQLLIAHADQVLTSVQATIDGSGIDEAALAKLLNQATDSIQEITSHTDTVLADAAQTLDAADTRAAMANIVTASASVQQTTADAAATMASIRKGVEFEVNELTKPVKKVKVVGEEAVRLLGRFLGY